MIIFFSKAKTLILVFILISASVSAQVKVACVGNSITEGWNGNPSYVPTLQKLLGPEFIVQNDGVSGTTCLKMGDVPYWTKGLLDQTIKFHADIITIMLGTNDTKPQNWNSYGSEFESDYYALIDTLSNSNHDAKIFLVIPVPVWENPYGIRNKILKLEIPIIMEIAEEKGLIIIDANTPLLNYREYFGDGVHPNSAGADTIASLIYSGISSYTDSRETEAGND